MQDDRTRVQKDLVDVVTKLGETETRVLEAQRQVVTCRYVFVIDSGPRGAAAGDVLLLA